MEAMSWFHWTTAPCPRVQACCWFHCQWMLSGGECSLIVDINQLARHKRGYRRVKERKCLRRAQSSPEAHSPRWTYSGLAKDISHHNQSLIFFIIIMCVWSPPRALTTSCIFVPESDKNEGLRLPTSRCHHGNNRYSVLSTIAVKWKELSDGIKE